jgi:PKD repeat protein
MRARLARLSAPSALAGALAVAGWTCAWPQPASAITNVANFAVTVVAPNGSYTDLIPQDETDANTDIDEMTTFSAGGSSPSGSDTTPGVHRVIGTSLARLAELAGVYPPAISSATVDDGNRAGEDLPAAGAPQTVTGSAGDVNEILDGFSDPNVADDTQPNFAVVRGDPANSYDELFFIRPMAFPGDANGMGVGSFVTVPYIPSPNVSSNTIDVTFHVTGPVLQVAGAPTASSSSPSLNAAVSFTAPTVQLNGQSDTDGDLTYSWDFGDGGAGASGASPTRAFPTAGSYQVRVTVSDAHAGAVGVSQSATVQVLQTRGGTPPTPTTPGQSQPGPSGNGQPGSQTKAGATKPLTGGGTAPNGLSSGKHAGATRTPASAPPPGTSSPTAKSGGPSLTSGAGSGTSAGGTGSSGTAGGAHGAATGKAGGAAHGLRTGGKDAKTKSGAATPVTRPLDLVGFVIDPAGAQSPLSVLESQAAAHQLATARVSQGSGRSGRSVTWILGVLALISVVSWGGLRELEPGALYRKWAA